MVSRMKIMPLDAVKFAWCKCMARGCTHRHRVHDMHEVAPSNVVSLLKFILQNVEAYFTTIGGQKIGGTEVLHAYLLHCYCNIKYSKAWSLGMLLARNVLSITPGGVDSTTRSFGLHPKLPKHHSASSEFFQHALLKFWWPWNCHDYYWRMHVWGRDWSSGCLLQRKEVAAFYTTAQAAHATGNHESLTHMLYMHGCCFCMHACNEYISW